WDGQWRMVIFDIPEDFREKRDLLRSLLKRNQFIKLQASVFISPYALNREAIEYLNISGLKRYIRIIKIDEIDSDEDLKKRFNLKLSKTS
ncbi:MAG: CRISPR-associated endonuclease Cas2, partial [Patescibacteria group bacterium]